MKRTTWMIQEQTKASGRITITYGKACAQDPTRSSVLRDAVAALEARGARTQRIVCREVGGAKRVICVEPLRWGTK